MISCKIALYRVLTVENYFNGSYSPVERAFVSSKPFKEGKGGKCCDICNSN